MNPYVGRLAPTPSGFLHKGHAFTFGIAYYRARKIFRGNIQLRIEDLDDLRCHSKYSRAILEDLRWLGLITDPCIDGGDEQGVIYQSGRKHQYREYLKKWIQEKRIYPSDVSRKQLREFEGLRYSTQGEVVFPNSLRPDEPVDFSDFEESWYYRNWRWKVPDEAKVSFIDQRSGLLSYDTGKDFGDFLVWTKSGVPSYEMAVVIDDICFGVTEVVRGEDLLVSTARQLLLYEALDRRAPEFFHCPLVKDENGIRLAKSYDSESIRAYRNQGYTPARFWLEMNDYGMGEAVDWLIKLN